MVAIAKHDEGVGGNAGDKVSVGREMDYVEFIHLGGGGIAAEALIHEFFGVGH